MSRKLTWTTSAADGCTYKFGLPRPASANNNAGPCVKKTVVKHKVNRKNNRSKANNCLDKSSDSSPIKPENRRLYEAIFCIESDDEDQMSNLSDELSLSLEPVNDRAYFESNNGPSELKTPANVTAAAVRYRQICEIGNARKRQQRKK